MFVILNGKLLSANSFPWLRDLSEILQNGCTPGKINVYSPTLIQEPWPFAGTINFTIYVDGSLLYIIIQSALSTECKLCFSDMLVNAPYYDHQENHSLWVRISTMLKIFSKMYNKWGGDDPHETCLTCKSMHLIMNIKKIKVYGWESRPFSR